MCRNRNRDHLVSRELRQLGWRVLRIWEHELSYPCRVVRKMKTLTAETSRS
jgi:G:T-mismatch repair DNA endonuclease (very short patch repair protein)